MLRPEGTRDIAVVPEHSLWSAMVDLLIKDIARGIRIIRSGRLRARGLVDLTCGCRAAAWFLRPSVDRALVLDLFLGLEIEWVLQQIRSRFGDDFDRLANLSGEDFSAFHAQATSISSKKRKKANAT